MFAQCQIEKVETVVCGRGHIELQCPKISAPVRKKSPVYWTSRETEGVSAMTGPLQSTNGCNILPLYDGEKSDIQGLALTSRIWR